MKKILIWKKRTKHSFDHLWYKKQLERVKEFKYITNIKSLCGCYGFHDLMEDNTETSACQECMKIYNRDKKEKNYKIQNSRKHKLNEKKKNDKK